MRRPLVVELGLLLEGRQLPIVERAATVGQRLDLVLQRLRLAWRDHRAELGVQAVAVAIDQARVVFGRIDLGRELVELAADLVTAAFPVGARGARGGRVGEFGEVAATVGELVGGRVDRLEGEELFGHRSVDHRHGAT